MIVGKRRYNKEFVESWREDETAWELRGLVWGCCAKGGVGLVKVLVQRVVGWG